jgi:hypothetical protein
VIARIVVFGEIYVVLPEEVISDQALCRMNHHGEIFQRKELRWSEIDTRSKPACELPLLFIGVAWRVQFKRAGIFATGIVQTAAKMISHAQLMMKLGRLLDPLLRKSGAINAFPNGDEGNYEQARQANSQLRDDNDGGG